MKEEQLMECPECGEIYTGWISEYSMTTKCAKCIKANVILYDRNIKRIQKQWRIKRNKILK